MGTGIPIPEPALYLCLIIFFKCSGGWGWLADRLRAWGDWATHYRGKKAQKQLYLMYKQAAANTNHSILSSPVSPAALSPLSTLSPLSSRLLVWVVSLSTLSPLSSRLLAWVVSLSTPFPLLVLHSVLYFVFSLNPKDTSFLFHGHPSLILCALFNAHNHNLQHQESQLSHPPPESLKIKYNEPDGYQFLQYMYLE